jgi:hypothetical protein
MRKATKAEKKVANFLWLSYYVIGLAKVWNFLTVRLADEHIKETKFPCNDKTSQQTKSVAKSAGGLENVRPKTELQ